MENIIYPHNIQLVFLKNNNIEVGIIPQLGGSIAFAKYKNIDFMRPWTGELTPRRTCCYPLIPFSNRIGNGKFKYLGKIYFLEKNFGDHPHTIHGVGWQNKWNIEALTDSQLTISYTHNIKNEEVIDWPFLFKVKQHFFIDKQGLIVKMEIENTDNIIAPLGCGWHPFFPKYNELNLKFKAESVLINDISMLPKKISSIPIEWDFSHGNNIDTQVLDNCFINWKNCAVLNWPKKNLTLTMESSENLSHLVIMTPPKELGDFIAIEPVSHINDALNSNNMLEQGIKLLEPGQTISSWMRLHINESII